MESTLAEVDVMAAKGAALFGLFMCFSAYAQLLVPQVAKAFTHRGLPAYVHGELWWAKFRLYASV
jgi:hypothetical protein